MSGICAVGDQHVDVRDHVGAVALDQALRRALDHVDGRFVFGHMVAELGRPEHHVVAQVVRFCELRVVIRTDRIAG